MTYALRDLPDRAEVVPRKVFESLCRTLQGEYVTHRFLACGAHNEHYLLTIQGEGNLRNVVVRISSSQRLGALEQEYNSLLTAGRKLGLDVFLYDKSGSVLPRDILVQEYVDGQLVESVLSSGLPHEFIDCMALWYRELHREQFAVPAELANGGLYNLDRSIQYHVLNWLTPSIWALGESLRKRVQAIVATCQHTMTAYSNEFRNSQVPLVQGDPTRGNIFFWPASGSSAAKVRVIDWEFARFDLEEFDLVFFVDTYDLTEEEIEWFLQRYGRVLESESLLRFHIVWLIHVLRIVAWRTKRVAMARTGRLKPWHESSNEGVLLEGIEGGLTKARRQLGRIYEITG